MTPREELIEIINRPGVVHHFMAQADVERLADAILAAGYRKVEAGRDARETAQNLVSEILKEHRHDDPRELNPTCGSCENKVATAITAAVEAQRERDARIVDEYKRDDPEYAICAGYRWHLAAAIREG